VIAAVSLSAPEARMSERTLAEAAAGVIATAAAISQRLGYER
jgi:DNA-binding IclR family transcriptional regulator